MKFTAVVVLEGKVSKGDGRNRRICVPAEYRGSIAAPCWVWMRVDGGSPFFAKARRTKSRASIDITLPSFAVPRLPSGRTVDIELKMQPDFAFDGTPAEDWLPHIDRKRYLVQPLLSELWLWSGHEEPFSIRRSPVDEGLHWWLLGFYQAEGSKKKAVDFHVSNTNPELLADTIEALGVWGITRERLRLGLVYREGTTDKEVRARFKPLDLPITFARATEKNDPCALLYVNGSLPLIRAVVPKLAHVFKNGFPSRAAALAYALGWLDGDGSISGTGSEGWSIGLRLAGTREEHEVLLHALERALGWKILHGSFGAIDGYTERVLTLSQAAELAIAGAFVESLNRARLIYLLGERLARYHGQRRSSTTEADASYAQRLFDAKLSKEAAELALHPLAANRFKTGNKCEPYPIEKGRLDHRPRRP